MRQLCAIDGCYKPFKARGLCSTHYNQQHQPNRHQKIYVACDCCGTPVEKEQRKQRYAGVYCSYLCRDYTKFGPTKCAIPSKHWSRMIGATCQWTPPRTPATYTLTCAWCEATVEADRQEQLYCDDRCSKRAAKVRRRGRVAGAHGTYTWAQVARLWVAFGKACAYCREQTPLQDIQAEHVIAIARGGANNIGNILPSCAHCNADKRDLSMDEWQADRERRKLPQVTTHWDATDPLYSHLTDANYRLAA